MNDKQRPNQTDVDGNYIEDIICDIENMPDALMRTVAYSSIVLYLAELSKVIDFKKSEYDARNKINEGLKFRIQNIINRDIKKIETVMKLYIKDSI